MLYLRLNSKIAVIPFIVSQSLFSLSAFAAGFQINEISPSLQGDALAGAAAAYDDVSSLFINPATLATLTDAQAYFGASELLPHIKTYNGRAIHTVNVPGIPPSDITAEVQGQTSQGRISPSALVPDAYIGWRMTDNLYGGIGIIAPFGLKTRYDKESVLRFAAVYSAVKTIDVNPVLAYNFNDQWAIGAGFQAQYLRAKFSNFNGPYTGDPSIDEFVAANYPTYLLGDGWGYGYNVGLLFRPCPQTRLGIGYRSYISEDLSGIGQQMTSPTGETVPAPSPDFLFNAATDVFASVRTPDVLTMSAAHDIARWTLKATAQVNFWHSFKELTIFMPQAFAYESTIQAQWKNTWFGSLGAEYHATPCVTLRGGVAYDETPTRNKFRDPRIPDANRVWLNVGGSYFVNDKISIDGAYSHIFMRNQTVNVTQASGHSLNSTLPLEVNQVFANYRGSADVVALAVRYLIN